MAGYYETGTIAHFYWEYNFKKNGTLIKYLLCLKFYRYFVLLCQRFIITYTSSILLFSVTQHECGYLQWGFLNLPSTQAWQYEKVVGHKIQVEYLLCDQQKIPLKDLIQQDRAPFHLKLGHDDWSYSRHESKVTLRIEAISWASWMHGGVKRGKTVPVTVPDESAVLASLPVLY